MALPSGSVWGHLRSIWGHLRSDWGHLRSFWGHLGGVWGHFGSGAALGAGGIRLFCGVRRWWGEDGRGALGFPDDPTKVQGEFSRVQSFCFLRKWGCRKHEAAARPPHTLPQRWCSAGFI